MAGIDSYRKLAALFGAAAAVLGLLGLSGWVLGMPLLASIRSSYIPMAPLTSIVFLCLGGALIVHSIGSSKGPAVLLAAALSALFSAYGLIELVESLGIPLLALEERLFLDPPMIGAIPTGRMSPVTAAILLLSGAVVPMLFLRERGGKRQKLFGDMAGCLGILVTVGGTVIVLSYLHGTPLLYGTSTIPMAGTTALAFLLLGAGQVLAAGPDSYPSRLVVGPSARARLLRAFVSTTACIVVAIDLLHVYARGIFFEGDPFLSGVSITVFVVVTGALIARVALKVGDDMDRSEEVRRRAEEKLRESEDRFRDLVEHTQDLVCTHDLEGRILSANPWASKVLGYAPDELLRMNLRDLLVPEVRHQIEGYLEEIRTHGTARGLLQVQTRNGERRIWEYKNTLRTEGVAEPIVRGMAQDITERKRAEDGLRESERRYRGLFEHMQEGIAYCRMIFENDDPVDFIYLSVNAAFETLTGLKNVEGKKVSEVVPGIRASDPSLFETYGRVARTGKPEKIDIFVEALQQWFLISVYSPEQGYFVAVFDVVTDRKRAEAEKEKLQVQLQHAMKMEAVGRLAGGVAHDFNNLLTVIIGNVALALGKSSPSEPVAELLSEVNKAAERAALLTQQLLAFSRKQIIEPKILNLNDLIADLNKMLIRLIREDIDLKILPGEDLGPVKIDPGQFEQAMVNLVVNARDAMPEGGTLLIETSNVDLDEEYCARHPYTRPGPFIMLAVSDTGHGMDEEVKKQIFEPFFTTKPKGTGTGLGLATAYGAAKQAGGSIEVYSEVGKGTTFKIYLPRVEGESARRRGADLTMELQGGSETVMIVEDEEIVRNLGVRILEGLGYRVMQAGNGDEALALAKERGERIDLLMTDVVMPGMNGRELAKQFPRIHPETRVLFTSGYTDNAIVHHGVLDEGVSFIGKPYSPSALAKKIREVLDKVE